MHTPPHSAGTGTPATARQLVSAFDLHHATVDGTSLVPDHAADAPSTSTPSPERSVDRVRPTGQLRVATEVASFRRRFIWKFAAGEGIPQAVL